MKTNHTLLLLAILLCSVISSCQKYRQPSTIQTGDDNGVGQAFDVVIEELRGETRHLFTWELLPGNTLDNHEEKIKTLVVTSSKYGSEFTLKASGSLVSGSAWKGVNVSVDNPRVVSVSRVGDSKDTFSMTYMGDGDAVITVSSGSKTPLTKSFRVQAKEYIDVEGLWFTWGDEDLIVKHVFDKRPPMVCYSGDNGDAHRAPNFPTDYYYDLPAPKRYTIDDPEEPGQRINVSDPTVGKSMFFRGLYPENATFRMVEDFESESGRTIKNVKGYIEYDWGRYGDAFRELGFSPIDFSKYNWPNVRGCHTDVSTFIGAGFWMTGCQASEYVASVHIKCVDNKDKYLVLYADNAPEPTW